MRKILSILVSIFLFPITATALVAADQKNYILPEQTRLYLSEDGELAEVQLDSSFREIMVPMINYYQGEGGCYLVCYSIDADHSAYPIGNGAHVVGQIRIDGKYFGSRCVSKVAMDADELDLCHKFFPNQCFSNACWLGAETGAWFGLE